MIITAPNFEGIEGLVHGFGLRDFIWPPGVTLVKQIHSDIVTDAAELANRINEPIPEADAIVSKRTEVLIGVKTADCVPILIADPVTGAIASIHAGWRGTAQNIVPKAIGELAARWHSRPEDLRVAVGPAIGGCCYEVGAEVARHFGIDTPGAVHIDLAAINRRQIVSSGVRNIWVSGECTFCSPGRFFSYRREKEQAGRMLSYIGWQK